MATSGGAGAAHNASVTTELAVADLDVLRREAQEAADAVQRIEEKLDGWRQSLVDAKAAAKTAAQRVHEVERD